MIDAFGVVYEKEQIAKEFELAEREKLALREKEGIVFQKWPIIREGAFYYPKVLSAKSNLSNKLNKIKLKR